MAWTNPQWPQQPNYGMNGGGYTSPMQTSPYRPPVGPQGQMNSMDWIRVPNVPDVEQVSVQPGQTAWIMVQNNSVFAVRMADPMGMVTTKYFQFAEFDPRQADQQKQNSIEQRLSRLEAIVNGTAEPTDGHFKPADQTQ